MPSGSEYKWGWIVYVSVIGGWRLSEWSFARSESAFRLGRKWCAVRGVVVSQVTSASPDALPVPRAEAAVATTSVFAALAGGAKLVVIGVTCHLDNRDAAST